MSNVQAPLTPESFIREVQLVLPCLSQTERINMFELAMAHTTVTYNGDVPSATNQLVAELEMQCRSLMTRADG